MKLVLVMVETLIIFIILFIVAVLYGMWTVLEHITEFEKSRGAGNNESANNTHARKADV